MCYGTPSSKGFLGMEKFGGASAPAVSTVRGTVQIEIGTSNFNLD